MKEEYSLRTHGCKLYILPAEVYFCKYFISWLVHILCVCIVWRCFAMF